MLTNEQNPTLSKPSTPWPSWRLAPLPGNLCCLSDRRMNISPSRPLERRRADRRGLPLAKLRGRARQLPGDRGGMSGVSALSCLASRTACPGKEICKHGALGDDADELSHVVRSRIVAQLGHRPLPAIARRLQRHANHHAGNNLRPDRPAGKSGNPQSANDHFEDHFG